jgi:glutamyl-tRNA synthetase/nondiscriminating glutamyl-tRNA synthetase
MKESSLGRLLSLAIPFLRDAGWVDEIDGPIQAWIEGLVDAALPRIDHLSQIVEMADLLLDFGLKRWEDTLGIQEKLKASGAGDVVRALCQEVKDPSRDIAGDWKQIVAAVKKRTGQKGKELFHPIRIALTGSDSGPELDKLVPLLEDGSRLPLRRKVKSCRERICEVAQILS